MSLSNWLKKVNELEDPQEKELLLLRALQLQYSNSLFKTCKYLLNYKDITHYTHGDMVKALEAPTTRKLIVYPRGTFKSSIGVVGFSIWSLMRNPNLRILIESELFKNARNYLREIKAHLQSPKFIELFGDWRSDNWNDSEITISQRTEIRKEPSIMIGGIETVKVGVHVDLIISDDLNSGNNSKTTDGCEKVLSHYKMNLAILEPQGTYVVIGTRYSNGDLIGNILEKELELDHKSFTGEYVSI